MSLLVLGHYRFAPFHTIGWRIHLFIWLEAAAAIALVVWLLVSWRRTKRLGFAVQTDSAYGQVRVAPGRRSFHCIKT